VTYCIEQFVHYLIYELYIFRPTNYSLQAIPNPVCYLQLLSHNLYHFIAASVFICRWNFFSRLQQSVPQTVCTVGLRAEWHSGVLNRKVTDRIIDLDTEEKVLLNRVIEQYVKTISVRAAVS